MIRVAKVMEPRTSLDALKITAVLGSGVGRWAFCLRRRKTFSTFTIASSTSWPIAMARPPSVIVLMPIPNQLMTSTVATKERGMAVRLMNVVPKFQRKRNEHDRHHDPALDQGRLHVADRALDEVRLPEGGRVHAHVGR